MSSLILGLSRLSRRSKQIVGALTASLLVMGVIVYASIPDSGGVIHGCYKRNNGTLRVIDTGVSQCDNSETPIQWNQTGPQGAPAPPRLITVGSGSADMQVPMGCGDAIRSMTVTKQSDASRLRITYKDDGFVEESTPGGSREFSIRVLIDGSAVSPTPLYSNIQGDLENIAVSGSVSTFGYADGVSAGVHTITTQYVVGGSASCFRTGAYTIEAEEISQ